MRRSISHIWRDGALYYIKCEGKNEALIAIFFQQVWPPSPLGQAWMCGRDGFELKCVQTMVLSKSCFQTGYQALTSKHQHPSIGLQASASKHRPPSIGLQASASKHRPPSIGLQASASKHRLPSFRASPAKHPPFSSLFHWRPKSLSQR